LGNDPSGFLGRHWTPGALGRGIGRNVADSAARSFALWTIDRSGGGLSNLVAEAARAGE